MRSSRLAKFGKKNKKLIIFGQLLMIWYAVFISITLLTSSTVAYFSSNSEIKPTISTAEDWWDKSELVFPNKGTQVEFDTCPPDTSITVEIKNKGLDMTRPTEYEVYYSEKNGNPEKNGESIEHGLIEPIKNGMSSTLTYDVEKEGWYIFKALQREGFKNNYDVREELWSEKIKVKCKKQKQVEIETELEKVDTETKEEPIEEVTEEPKGELSEEITKEPNEEKEVIEPQKEAMQSDSEDGKKIEKQTEESNEQKDIVAEKDKKEQTEVEQNLENENQ